MTMQIELAPENLRAIHDIAEALHKSPEETAAEVLANGIHTLKRQMFYADNIGRVTAEQGLEILRRYGKGVPPDPGDELPEGFHNVPYASIAPE